MVAGRCIASTIATLESPADRPRARQSAVGPFRPASRDAFRERVARRPHLLAGRGGSRPAHHELDALGADAITRDERTQAFERLQVPQAAVLTDATVIRLGQLVGASQVIVGSLDLAGDTLVVRARSLALEPGRLQRDVVERGRMPELFGSIQRLARTLGPASAGCRRTPADARPGAFENYIKGLLAETRDRRRLPERLPEECTRLRSRRVALWARLTWSRQRARRHRGRAGRARRFTLSRRARFLTGLSELELKQYPRGIPRSQDLRRETDGGGAEQPACYRVAAPMPPQVGASIYFFSARRRARSEDDPDCLFNLGYAYCGSSRMPAARFTGFGKRPLQPRRRPGPLRARHGIVGGSKRREASRES